MKTESENTQTNPSNTDSSMPSPIFWGTPESLEIIKKKRELFVKPIDLEAMKEITVAYGKRIIKSSKAVDDIDLQKEAIVLYIKWENLDVLRNGAPASEGLMAILSVDVEDDTQKTPMHQTFILAPCDGNGKALPLADQGYYGEQRWPKAVKKVSNIVSDNTNDEIIKRDIETYYTNDLGFPEK